MMRVNIGCGPTPTQGWRNFDNSLSLRLAKIPLLPFILWKLQLINTTQYEFIQFAGNNLIEYGDATKGLPIPDGTIEVIYSSHMLEHLDREEVGMFLKETRRILQQKGIIRLAVPDINKFAEQYVESGDADVFIEAARMCVPRPRSLSQRLRLLLVGTRHHQWMYDGNSLSKLLEKHGFVNVKVFTAGETMIKNYEPLDLHERSSQSVYVEAESPTA